MNRSSNDDERMQEILALRAAKMKNKKKKVKTVVAMDGIRSIARPEQLVSMEEKAVAQHPMEPAIFMEQQPPVGIKQEEGEEQATTAEKEGEALPVLLPVGIKQEPAEEETAMEEEELQPVPKTSWTPAPSEQEQVTVRQEEDSEMVMVFAPIDIVCERKRKPRDNGHDDDVNRPTKSRKHEANRNVSSSGLHSSLRTLEEGKSSLADADGRVLSVSTRVATTSASDGVDVGAVVASTSLPIKLTGVIPSNAKVEALVDAAMGRRAMPAAPMYFDTFGNPLTKLAPTPATRINKALHDKATYWEQRLLPLQRECIEKDKKIRALNKKHSKFPVWVPPPPTLKLPPKGFKGTLAQSQLKRSVALNQIQINTHRWELGLKAWFQHWGGAGDIVAGSPSHLTLIPGYCQLPYTENQILKFWVPKSINARSLNCLLPFDPNKHPQQQAVPTFWAEQDGAGKDFVCRYVGHFQCVYYDTLENTEYKGVQEQALLGFEFVRFDMELAETMKSIAAVSSMSPVPQALHQRLRRHQQCILTYNEALDGGATYWKQKFQMLQNECNEKDKQIQALNKKQSKQQDLVHSPPSVNVPPKSHDGTLKQSQLKRSVFLNQNQINSYRNELGLTAWFQYWSGPGGIVAGSPSHLTLIPSFCQLPHTESETLKYWVTKGITGRILKGLQLLDPNEHPQQQAVPTFWVGQQGKGEAFLCCYVGHFRCVYYDKLQDTEYNGMPLQGLLGFEFVRFDMELAETMKSIAASWMSSHCINHESNPSGSASPSASGKQESQKLLTTPSDGLAGSRSGNPGKTFGRRVENLTQNSILKAAWARSSHNSIFGPGSPFRDESKVNNKRVVMRTNGEQRICLAMALVGKCQDNCSGFHGCLSREEVRAVARAGRLKLVRGGVTSSKKAVDAADPVVSIATKIAAPLKSKR